MSDKINRIAFKVKPSAERMIRSKHPWVFDQSILKQSKEGKAGDLAIIFDQKKNKFLACGLYDPHSPIRIKLLQFNKQSSIDESWFEDTIEKAIELRKSFDESQHNAYRIIYGENDGLPGIILDKYADTLVMKIYSEIWFPYLEIIVKILIDKTQCERIVLRFSRKVAKSATTNKLYDGQFIYGNEKEEIEFLEEGLKFNANVIKGHKTGFFLDHRQNRIEVGRLAKGLNVLDVFSYAGGFSLHALAGGAKSACCIDISEKALAVAKQNIALNQLSAKFKTLAGDAFEILNELNNDKNKFDLIVIDPPSFAKSAIEVERALFQYERLVKLALPLLNQSGILVMASCSSRVKASIFYKLIEKTLLNAGKDFTCLKQTQHDIDHPILIPEAAYLKCAYYKIR